MSHGIDCAEASETGGMSMIDFKTSICVWHPGYKAVGKFGFYAVSLLGRYQVFNGSI
jgi:hypothetical protein